MKHLKTSITLLLLLTVTVVFAQSPRKQVKGKVGSATINIDYGSPSVKGRVVWGGLEAYGKVWRAGANENTTVSFDKEVTVGGEKLAAGKYGFFIIPNENADWIVIFNKKNADWGAYSYQQSQDALRISIKPEFVKDNQEALEYSVGKSGIDFAWEKARITIPVGM